MADTQPERFNLQQFDRQLAVSQWAKRGLIGLLAFAWAATFVDASAGMFSLICLLGAGCGWMIANHCSAQTARQTMQIGQMLAGAAPPPAIERQLHLTMNRFTMYLSVRAALYHQMALLRRRQGRFDDVAAICAALLDVERIRLAVPVRTKVRLLMADVSLSRGDLLTAWQMLVALRTDRLSLVELMQMLELQTRYEYACGYYPLMLNDLPAKVTLAEIMPPGTGAAMHMMFAQAAWACERGTTATWLEKRGQLLSGGTIAAHNAFVELGQTDGLAAHG